MHIRLLGYRHEFATRVVLRPGDTPLIVPIDQLNREWHPTTDGFSVARFWAYPQNNTVGGIRPYNLRPVPTPVLTSRGLQNIVPLAAHLANALLEREQRPV
jgi:hypothetical protein